MTIVIVASAAIGATSKKRSITPSAAAFVAVAMNAVTGVGAPSYTSGVHWWNGATDALKPIPASVSAMPVSSSGSLATPPAFAAIPA